LERTRLLLFYIKNETDLLTAKRKLLHFAPENSLLPILKRAKNLDYYSADINPDYADLQIDITDIPFPDDTFDYIICAHVLGYVPDEKKAVEEMYRVLKPDGIVLVQTLMNLDNPHTFETPDADTPAKRLQYYSEDDVIRLHGMDVAERLQAGGFLVETIDYRKAMGEEIYQRYSLGDGKRELIFKCMRAR
jgi:SAM-dependent methyltransferase